MGKLVIRIGDSWAWPDLNGCHDPNANFDSVLLTDNLESKVILTEI